MSLSSNSTTTNRRELGTVSPLSPDFEVYDCSTCPTRQYMFWTAEKKDSFGIISADCQAPDGNETTVCKCHRPYIGAGCHHVFDACDGCPVIFLLVTYLIVLCYLYLVIYGGALIRLKTLKGRNKNKSSRGCICNRVIAGIWISTIACIGRVLFVGLDPMHYYLLLPESVYTLFWSIPIYLICIAELMVFESWMSFITLNTEIKCKCSTKMREVMLAVAISFILIIGVTQISIEVLPLSISDELRSLVVSLSSASMLLLAVIISIMFAVVGCQFSQKLKVAHLQNDRLRQIAHLSTVCVLWLSVAIVLYSITGPLYLFLVGKTIIGWSALNLEFRLVDGAVVYLLLRLFEGEAKSTFGIPVWARMCKQRFCRSRQRESSRSSTDLRRSSSGRTRRSSTTNRKSSTHRKPSVKAIGPTPRRKARTSSRSNTQLADKPKEMLETATRTKPKPDLKVDVKSTKVESEKLEAPLSSPLIAHEHDAEVKQFPRPPMNSSTANEHPQATRNPPDLKLNVTAKTLQSVNGSSPLRSRLSRTRKMSDSKMNINVKITKSAKVSGALSRLTRDGSLGQSDTGHA